MCAGRWRCRGRDLGGGRRPGLPPRFGRVLGRHWLPSSRYPSSDRTQRSGPAAVSGAAPLVSRMHSHMRTCSWWAIPTARIAVRTTSQRRPPAQAIMSRAAFRNARPGRAPVARAMSGSGGSGDSAPGHGRSLRAPGRPMRIRFITDLPRSLIRSGPGPLLIRRSCRIRRGKCRACPWLVSDRLVAVWSPWRGAGQGPVTPFEQRQRPGSDDPQAPRAGRRWLDQASGQG